jgi:multiple sugar transport system substrate-binding protein
VPMPARTEPRPLVVAVAATTARSLVICGVLLAGCQKAETPSNPTPTFPGISIKVGALGDAAILGGVAPQRGEWEASRKGEIAIRDESLTPETLSSIDVVLFPAQQLGNLVNAGVLAPIPNAAVLPAKPPEDETGNQERREQDLAKAAQDDTFQYKDIAPAFREDVSKYGPERVALPCGGSALVLVYRRDAFASVPNREAARQAGLSLEQMPDTWPQLDALAKFFQGRDWDGDRAPDHGITFAIGADPEGVGDAIFLARAASLGLHRDQYSFLFDADDMSPRIASPPFVEALQGLVALTACGPTGMARFDAAAARKAFRAGKVALLIDRAECAATWSDGKPVGVAPLPGSDRVFVRDRKEWTASSPRNSPSYLPHGGGWLVGINGRLAGTQLEAALDFAKYLANPENSNRLRAERAFPMLPVRTSQMGQGMPDPLSAPDVDSRLWSDAVSRTLLAERVVPGLRIPGADGYLSDLSKGRVAAAAGEAPDKALGTVAKAWTERTKAAGTQRQLWHYRRSLNTLATLPQPPEPGK